MIFLLACLARIRMYARAPLHLRWEVYPVPHERPDRAKHGGSRFEEVDWWQKPDRAHLAGELGFMIVSDGTGHPWRMKIRSPSMTNLSALPLMLKGGMISDIVAVIGSIDPVMGEADK